MSNILRGVIMNPDKIYGKSAYELAVKYGFVGTEEEWVKSIVKGADGITPHIGENGNWWFGDTDTGVKAAGTPGANGKTPQIGSNGNWWIGENDTGVQAAGTTGAGIAKIEKTGTNGLVDTYTITLTDGGKYTFTVKNGEGSGVSAEVDERIEALKTRVDALDGLNTYILELIAGYHTSGGDGSGGDDTGNGNTGNTGYKNISITRFYANPNIYEMCSPSKAVTAVNLNWETNKTPSKVTLDGNEISDKTATNVTVNGNFTTNTEWELKVTGENGETDTATASITFLNGVYYGAAEKPTSYNSAFILGLFKRMVGGNLSFTVDAADNQYIYYCVPKRFGTCNFSVGVWEGGFRLEATIPFTNSQGYTEDYYIYRSDEHGLGDTSVSVK